MNLIAKKKKKKRALLRCIVRRPKKRVLTSGRLTCRAQNKAEGKRDLQLKCSKNQSKDFDWLSHVLPPVGTDWKRRDLSSISNFVVGGGTQKEQVVRIVLMDVHSWCTARLDNACTQDNNPKIYGQHWKQLWDPQCLLYCKMIPTCSSYQSSGALYELQTDTSQSRVINRSEP